MRATATVIRGEIYAAGGWLMMRLVETSGTVLVDGFEDGTTDAWSVVP